MHNAMTSRSHAHVNLRTVRCPSAEAGRWFGTSSVSGELRASHQETKDSEDRPEMGSDWARNAARAVMQLRASLLLMARIDPARREPQSESAERKRRNVSIMPS